ncbi:MAG: hypothetical protein H6577_03535 [Lewinellaceae bacterium]|nr:hypothetical protein [Saprospiraceae bacterium]MCB9337176.1 hypothetical protein [Lewinellaceae bacterium]
MQLFKRKATSFSVSIFTCLLVFYSLPCTAQYTELASLPEPVSNNATVAAEANGKQYVFSFCGIDDTKIWSGIHLKAWRYDLQNDEWSALPDVPDPAGGKIAAAASFVKGKIYLIGGYHVASNGNETSSKKVHAFDPVANAWLPDAADLPVAIDDHVQAVWRDSLIYVVTGWSNSTNVPNVQVFNPTTNGWEAGTLVPNNNDYKVFGGSGVIVDDTIFYAGGARTGGNFPPTSFFRKGIINPDNPTEITWTGFNEPAAKGYRMAAATLDGKAVWLGGSDVTYNFNGIAYNGSGGVPPLDRITVFDPNSGHFSQATGDMPKVMDLRGAAQIANSEVIIAGGMEEGQQVTDKVWRIHFEEVLAVETPADEAAFYKISSNPANSSCIVKAKKNIGARLFDWAGKMIFQENGHYEIEIPVSQIPGGIYWLEIVAKDGQRALEKLVVQK